MNLLEPFHQISTFIFDIDGVWTNSQLLITEEGHLLRSMNTRDGYAAKKALAEDYRICVITGGNSLGVEKRMRALGVRDYYSGVHDKLDVYKNYVEGLQLNEEEILFMGDDLPDYPPMRRVGLPVCPADAAPEIKSICRYISPFNGGEGCVRDVIEKVLKLKDLWHER
ncbi:MAG: HAD-IIIA family hydrolase [Saprospiraceae bacterium]|nr:HAD-IIIA family hydrolase [Saprospiraceae bacterium]